MSNTGVTHLKDIGLTKMDSHRAQRVFEHQNLIPMVVAKAIYYEIQFAKRYPEFSNALEIPWRQVIKLLPQRNKTAINPPLPPGVFEVIYADPPWQYDFSKVDAGAVEG